MANPDVKSFFDESTNTISHIVVDPGSKDAVIIDPVLAYDAASGRTDNAPADILVDYVTRKMLKIRYIIETHAHADHLSSAPYLQDKLGGKIAIGKHIDTVQEVFGNVFNAEPEFKRDGSQFDLLIEDGQELPLGDLNILAIHTPGHTPACMSFLIGDALFVGDTLFMPDFGTARCDFPGGDAKTLYHSIQKLFELPDTTRVFLCHDYKAPGRDIYAWETTIGEQKTRNIHVGAGKSEDEFVEMRTARDATLSMPKLILPSVQINMRAGHMPPAEDNGTHFVKIPINIL